MADPLPVDNQQTPRPEEAGELSGVSPLFGELNEDGVRGKGEHAVEREEAAVVEVKGGVPKARTVRESLRLEEDDLMHEMDQMSKSSSPVPFDELTPAPTAASTRKPPPASIETGLPSLSSSLALGNPQLSAVSASHHSLDSPTLQLVETLKAQLAAVSDQRDMLNTKLVRNISRVADLEDDLEDLQQQAAEQRSKLDILEYERKEHLHALDTGLLVEQSNVKLEMQRLASSLLDAQGKRDVAEEGRRTVESEVDDLAATLFQQANSMVATERLSRARAETRLATAEENLAVAESVTREMQAAMQQLHHSQSQAPSRSPSLSYLPSAPSAPKPRTFLPDLLPYAELLQFVSHLRSLRPLNRSSHLPPPTLVSLMSHPFIARIIIEDHDPALRLDFAPGVSFFNKKSITQAIMDGQLEVEPFSPSTLAQKLEGDITCALSGKTILPARPETLGSYLTTPMSSSSTLPPPPPSHLASSTLTRPTFSSGASRFFRRPASPSLTPRQLPSDSNSTTFLSAVSTPSVSLIYCFRIASSDPSTASQEKLHPVEQGWSLERLRATCELWRFVKIGIVAPIWAYDDGTEPTPPSEKESSVSVGPSSSMSVPGGGRPALPPRKKSSGWGLGGWGLPALGGGSSPKLEKEQPKLPPRKEVVVPPQPPTLPPRGLGAAVAIEPATTTPPKLPSRKPAPTEGTAVAVDRGEKTEEPSAPTTIAGEASLASDLRLPDAEAAPLSTSTNDLSASDSSPSKPLNNPFVNNISSQPSSADDNANPTSVASSSPLATTSTIPLASPSLSETDSSDGFHTPQGTNAPLPDVAVEHPTPKPEVATSPADFPLPVSAPPTPVKPKYGVVEGQNEDETVTTSAPAPSLEVVPETKPLVVETDSSPPVNAPATEASEPNATSSNRTSLDSTRPSTPILAPGAAPPPPLPKRAAARRAVPPPPGSGSRPSSISSVADLQQAPPNSLIQSSPLVSDAPAEPATSASVPPTTSNISTPTSIESPIKITPSSSSDLEPTLTSNAAIPPPLPSRDHHPIASSSSETPLPPSYPASSTPSDYPEDVKTLIPSLSEPVKERSEEAWSNGAKDEEEKKKERWEEKAWRELARLREELFWARLGAVKREDEDK